MAYREKAPIGRFVNLFTYLIALLFVFLWGVLLSSGMPAAGLVTLCIVSVIVLVCFYWFYRMGFAITDSFVSASFGPYKYKIPINDIESVEITGKPLGKTLGFGVRMGPGYIAFVSQNREPVVIKRSTGKKLIMTVRNPKKFSYMVREKMEK